ncbi:MAG: bile acid:sodium symporter family protein [Spongiibacter sp.]
MGASTLTDIGPPLSLFLIMVGMGMTLTPKDFREVLVAPRGTLFGLFAQIILLPAVAWGVAIALDLNPALAVGLVIIAACPGGTTSNLFVFLGKGDVALSILLTVLASLITIVTLPAYTGMALQYFNDSDQVLALPVMRTILTLFVIVLLPVMIGMLIRRYQPGLAARCERVLGLLGMVVLLAVIALVLVELGSEAVELFKSAGLAVIALNIVGLLLGHVGARVIGLPPEQAFAVAIELGIKNGTLGLMVTLTLLQSEAMSVPSAVYGVLMFVFGFIMIGIARASGLGQVKAA